MNDLEQKNRSLRRMSELPFILFGVCAEIIYFLFFDDDASLISHLLCGVVILFLIIKRLVRKNTSDSVQYQVSSDQRAKLISDGLRRTLVWLFIGATSIGSAAYYSGYTIDYNVIYFIMAFVTIIIPSFIFFRQDYDIEFPIEAGLKKVETSERGVLLPEGVFLLAVMLMVFMILWSGEGIWDVIGPGAIEAAGDEQTYLHAWVRSFTSIETIAYLPSIGVLLGLLTFQFLGGKNEDKRE